MVSSTVLSPPPSSQQKSHFKQEDFEVTYIETNDEEVCVLSLSSYISAVLQSGYLGLDGGANILEAPSTTLVVALSNTEHGYLQYYTMIQNGRM